MDIGTADRTHAGTGGTHKGKTRVIVVGAGTMGRGIAAAFLAHGADVVLLVRQVAGHGEIAAVVGGLAQSLRDAANAANAAKAADAADVADVAAAAQVPGMLSVAAIDGYAGWAGASLVIESVSEALPAKQAVFESLDAQVPPAIPIGSNSSGFPITQIAAGLATRSRMFNTHYFMPAESVPLVEVVLGTDSDPVLAEQVCALFAAHGKKPVLVKKDIPGFLANRIQHALMREVLHLIDSGIASPEDVDLAVRYSFGFRYAAVGPVLQKEISGWDSMAQAAAAIYPSLCNDTALAPCVQQMMADGHTGMKAGRGFMPWTADTAKAARDDYQRRLALALRVLE